MKTLSSIIAVIFFAVNFVAAQDIKFESLDVNYGSIEKGADGVRVFKFTNNVFLSF